MIHLWRCDEGPNENKQWEFANQKFMGAGNTSKCFAHKGSWNRWTDGDGIHVWDCVSGNDENNEKWELDL